MAYENLKSAIKQAIKNNNNQEITGDLLQSTLLNIVNVIGADYKFLGFASPSTVPPTSEEGRLFYFASEAGEYPNFRESDENEYVNIGPGVSIITKEANSNFWKADALFDIVQTTGEEYDKVMSQKAVSMKFTDLQKKLEAKKLKKIPILNPEICKDGSRYIDIENLILDLEIISSSERNFAPVSFFLGEGNSISIAFYEVDTNGHYLPTFKMFSINFNSKERTLLYVLDKEVSIDGYTAKVSIAIDSSAMTVNFDAYSPSFVSDSVHGKHWGLISILRMLKNTATDTDVNNLYLYGNSLFQNLAETNKFLVTNGAQSSAAGYTGYITGYIPVKQGEKYRCFGDFNYTSSGGNVWGYSDTSGNGPVDLGHCMNGTSVTIKIPNNVNYIRMCSKKTAGQVPYIVHYPSMESYFGENIERFNGNIEGLNDAKQSRISLFDMEKCASNPRIFNILDFLLDLELHWDDGQDDEVYALISIFGGGESKSVTFYAVDENGKYLNTFHYFNIVFGKVTGVKYLLDKKITTSSGKTGTCSIVVDWDKWTFNNDAMSPCYHSNSIYSEHVGPIMYLRQLTRLNNQLAVGFNVMNIENGKKITYLTTTNNKGIVSNVTSNSFEISTDNPGNSWSYTTPPFTPSGNNYVHIKCKLEDLTPDLEGSSGAVRLYLSDGRSTYDANGCVPINYFSKEIDYKFDPAYYTVYKNWTKFGVWLVISAGNSGGTKRWRVTDFEVYEVSESINGLSGNNAKELFEDVASKLSDINSEIKELGEVVDTELISPSGNKFELSVQDDGTLKALPIIPSKGAFFGNSLLVGSGYGMAASDDQHDYYYLINSYIKGLNNSYVYNKYTSTNFEGITSEDAIESAVNAVVNNLTGDETLVSIQLGDNVNTTEKNAVFPASSLALCKAIRAKCPNARVVWMGMWYSSDSKYQAIQNACKQTGCKFISYEGLKGSDANSKIGNIQKKSSAQRTISDVTNVVENSSSGSIKNITVTFTVSGSSYTSTLDVSSYSLNGGTLTYTSEFDIITSGGAASHPGDEGFRRISNRFLYEMKLTDDKEHYKKL